MTIWNKPLRLLQTTQSLKTDPVTLSSFALRKETFCSSPTFKRDLCPKRMAIGRAYSHSYHFLEIKPINTFPPLRGLNLSFRRKKGILPCFALEEGNDNPFTSEKKEIQMGQEGPSVWIVNKVQNFTKKLTRHKVANSMPSSFEHLLPNKQKKMKFYTFGRSLHYQLQKYFSKIELNLRQGSQLFTVYVFGSFCWLYLIRYSSGTSQFTLSKSFLFQDIFLENLPLLSENKLFSGEITEKSVLTPLLDNSLTTPEKRKTNTKFQAIELTSSFSENLESSRVLKSLTSEKLEAFTDIFSNSVNPEILLFFARKPIFIKNFSLFPGNTTLEPSFKGLKSEHQEKELSQNSKAHKPKSAFLFFKKQTLPQKTIYALSGTSLIVDPEIDILPRKLEGLVRLKKSRFSRQSAVNKKQIIHKQRTGKLLKKKLSSINFQPLGKFESSTKRVTQASQEAKGSLLTLPQNLLWCKNLFSRTIKWSENSLLVQEPAKTQQELQKLAVPVQQNNFRLAHSKDSEIVNQKILFQNISLKGKNEVFDQKRKVHFIDSFKEPSLQSGFEFPNVPIIEKNKEKLKRGLGITIKPKDLFGITSTIRKPKSFSVKKQIKKKAKNLNSQPKINSSNYVLNLNSKLECSKKLIFHTKPFLDWHYQPEFKAETLFYCNENNERIRLSENKKTSEFVILDQHTDLKTNPCSLGQKLSLQKKENTFLEDVFSYKRKSFNGALDAPEHFFGNPYLKLGERFTIEKLHGKTQLQTLSSLHGGDIDILVKTPASPIASMGTSLNTVFGKKQFTKKDPTSKENSKGKNVLATSRLVTSWSKGVTLENQILLKNWLIEEKGKGENDSLTWEERKQKLFKILYFKEKFGKKNRKLNLLFKYYQPPGMNKEKRTSMYVTEGYKKSKLFPTIHTNYRILAYQSVPIYDIEDETINMDIDLQSILGGMRQSTETQRRAYYLQQLSPENLTNKKSEDKNIILSKKTKRYLALEQKKKIDRLSNYYPPFTSLIVSPQKSFPQKALGSRELVDYNLSSSFKVPTLMSSTEDLKGSIQRKGFYFEKFLCSTDKGLLLLISTNFLSKFFFFAVTWYTYTLVTKPLFKALKLLPATFTEAIGLQSFQEKFRIIKGKKGKQTFKNLAGAEKTLAELRDLIWTFQLVGTQRSGRKNNIFTFLPYLGNRRGQSRSSVFSKSPNRLLLLGPPGTGKTLLVKALAAEANLPVIVQPASSLRMISGVENPVSALFHVARQIKPCIIFLDELDTLGSDINLSTKKSTAEQQLGIRLARKYTYTLLLELDGLTSSTDDLLIIGATNRPETLNPALTRAGRFETILDFNLPSQTVRTSLFSFYLRATEQAHQNKKLLSRIKNNLNLTKQFMPSKSSKSRNKPKLKQYLENSKKSVNKAFSLESYLAGKCSGLSHASIGTIINESALEAMLQGGSLDQPLHTLETLERAINSVKTLTLRSTSSNFNSTVFSSVLSKDSQQNDLLSKINDKENYLATASLKSEKEQKIQSKVVFKDNRNFSFLIKPFEQEFLVNRIYQIIGSLIFDQKIHQGPKKPFFYARRGAHSSSLFLKKLHKTTKQKRTPINRKDFQSLLLREYSGKACSAIYTTLKPQTFKILARSGLYQDPSYVASILLTLKGLTQNNFLDKILYKENTRPRTLNKKEKQEGFISEKFIKEFFPYNSNLDSSNFQSTVPQKSLLFWKNPKVFKKAFSGGAFPAKQSKERPQTLLMDLKAANCDKTSWFRVYLSRPFFQYDAFHYIENKEYYPKNNYIVKQKSLVRRNVSTLSHTTSPPSANLKQLDSLSKKNLAFDVIDPVLTNKNKITGKLSHQISIETKDSLYLAIVASIFHKSIEFFEKNRELTDYCAYTFLRYGMLYDFYQEAITKKF